MKTVKILKQFDNYFPGDVCGLEDEYAKKRIELGYAEPVAVATPTKKTKD